MDKTPITKFVGEFEFLSNFYPSDVYYAKFPYPTVEHAFQIAKKLNPISVDEWQDYCRLSAGQTKRLGMKLALRPDWENVKIGIMFGLLEQKFSNDPLKTLLINTHPRILMEGNNWGDIFWGVDERKGGANVLGVLLMQVRANLV